MLTHLTQLNVEIWIGLGIALGVLFTVFAAIFLYGCLLPRSHRVARTLVLQQSPQTVWDVITDHAQAPSWHRGIIKVERLPDRNGQPLWRETYKGNYGMQLETTTSDPPHRLVRTIADENGPFTGCWDFVLEPQSDGCKLTITETGEVANPFFRFMFRMFMNPAYYLEQYLQALAGRFSQPATTESV